MSKFTLMLGVTAAALLISVPSMADTQTVTKKTSVVNPDGSVSYQTNTVVKEVPTTAATTTTTTVVTPGTVVETGVPIVAGTTVVTHPVTFYYWEPATKHIVANSTLSDDILSIWDTDHNHVIDNHEYYNDAMVMYEPVEYSKRTYQDLNMDGSPELTQEEYTVRMQKVPTYGSINTDKKAGLSLYEFTGIGFQKADLNNDNQVSFDEIRKVFYDQPTFAEKLNK